MIRRAWRVLADPPRSGDAWLLRNLAIPTGVLLSVLGLMPFWTMPPAVRPFEVVWVYALLWAIRQRDQARAEVARLRSWQP